MPKKSQRLFACLIALVLLSLGLNLSLPVDRNVTARDNVNDALKGFSFVEGIGHETKENDDSFSACLLVMDDNHFLIEWLAYHYPALPLRHLIVAVDPRSKTSPSLILNRWRKHGMNVREWKDQDFINKEEREEAEYWAGRKFSDAPRALIQHRARQRLFYYHCMRQFKEEGRQWLLMTDSDEFVRVNYKTVDRLLEKNNSPETETSTVRVVVPPITEPGSVLSYLRQEVQRPGNNLTTPCVQIPRIRFGTQESLANNNNNNNNSVIPMSGFNASAFQTLRFRSHAHSDNYFVNRISKVMIDLHRVSWESLAPVESIHMPIKDICKRRRLHIRADDQVFIIHHYLGTWEQYTFRDDSRAGKERSLKVGWCA
jgi:hypothetical protein